MLLEYEKEILRESNGESCLLVMGGGLNIQKILLLNVGFYLNKNSLVLLVNLTSEDKAMVMGASHLFVHDVGQLHRLRRRRKYLYGGVYIASPRVFVSDMIDGTIDIEKISCILINNVESVTETSTESFMIHLFRNRNKDGLVKGFSECAISLSLGFFPLDKKLKSLKLDRVLFFPRFHKKVDESLNGDVDLVEIRIKLPVKVMELQVILMEIIDGLLSNVFRGMERQEINAEMVVFGGFRKMFRVAGISNHRVTEDIHNMRNLMFLLFSCDAATFYWYTRRIFREQVQLGKESTWINLSVSHVLVDKAKELFEGVTGKIRNILGDQDTTFAGIEGYESCKRPRVSVDTGSDNVFDEDDEDEAQLDEEVRRMFEVDDDRTTAISNLSSDAKRSFYISNPKIKKLIETLGKLRGTVSIVLVSNCIVKNVLTDIITEFDFIIGSSGLQGDNPVLSILTHYEFKYYESEYENVIFMEPSQDSVRKIEIYGVTNALKVYFLIYSSSLEEQRYLNEIRREKASFEKLIEERSRLPLRLDTEEEAIDLEDYEDSGKRYSVVVDVRELRSDLPFYLFRARNDICISTLPVGDYLLGTKTCIERKSVSDFISSLNSGRLYLQAKMLCYEYSNPLLLLEFDGRPCLSDHCSHNQDTFKNGVLARFALFLSHFSQIRVIWSDSRLFSTRVIRDLQKHEEDPPVVGEDSSMDPKLQEILLSVPGITQFNLRRVVGNFSNLKDLIFSSRDRLEQVFGGERSIAIHDFFRRRI